MQTFDGDLPDGDLYASRHLNIRIESDSQGACVRLAGELDLDSVPEVNRLVDALTEELHSRLLIDLAEVTFMDSTGLASILRAQRSAEANGHQFTLRRGSDQVQRLFGLTGMLDHFTFED